MSTRRHPTCGLLLTMGSSLSAEDGTAAACGAAPSPALPPAAAPEASPIAESPFDVSAPSAPPPPAAASSAAFLAAASWRALSSSIETLSARASSGSRFGSTSKSKSPPPPAAAAAAAPAAAAAAKPLPPSPSPLKIGELMSTSESIAGPWGTCIQGSATAPCHWSWCSCQSPWNQKRP